MTCKIPKLPEIEWLDKCATRNDSEFKFNINCEKERGLVNERLKKLFVKNVVKFNKKCGSFRCVYLSKKCAIKVAEDYYGITSNRKEADTWELVKNTPLQEVFTPVDDSTQSSVIITMPRVQTNFTELDKYKIIDEIKDKLKKYNLYCENLSGLNVGRLNHKPVVFDYGGYPMSTCGLRTIPIPEKKVPSLDYK